MSDPTMAATPPKEHTNRLAALAVFMNSYKEEYIKSIHVYYDHFDNSTISSVQQEFLFDPGNYRFVSEPVNPLGLYRSTFAGIDASAGGVSLPLKHFMASLKKMQELDGWKCLVEFSSDCPGETTMVELLSPSRNARLSSLPSLAQDLAIAEAALLQTSSICSVSNSRMLMQSFAETASIQSSNAINDGPEWTEHVKADHRVTACTNFVYGGDTLSKLSSGSTAMAMANPPLNPRIPAVDHMHSFHDIPGLETPDRSTQINCGMNQGMQCSLLQTWGSDLELASPRFSQGAPRSELRANWSTNPPECVSNQGVANVSLPSSNNEDLSVWSSPSLLELSLQLPDITSNQHDIETLPMQHLTNPRVDGYGDACQLDQLDIGVDTSLGLPGSTLTAVEGNHDLGPSGIDCFSLDCFGLDSSICGNFYPEYMETMEQEYSAGSLCINSAELPDNNGLEKFRAGTRQAMHGFQSIDAFLGTQYGAEHGTLNTLSSDSNVSNGVLQYDMTTSLSSTSNGENAYSSTLKGATTTASTSDMYWTNSAGVQNMLGSSHGRVTRRSVHQTTSTSSNMQGSSPQKHNTHRGSSERVTEITLQELSHYFNMPITQASKELKVGLTVLKKKCREFGIPRWPHRKMKSLDSLISNIQDLASEHGGRGSARVQNAVKELEEQKRLMEEMPGIELAERTKRLRQACFKASYKKRRLLAATTDQPQQQTT